MKRYIKSSSDFYLGKNSALPSKDEIMSGNATYAGLPIEYHPEMSHDACNMDYRIWVSDKFFGYDEPMQKHILNHEVAHDFSDELMREHAGDWQKFASYFIQEKDTPPKSPAYERGQRTYWVGLYGDIGAIALSETLTRAITEYLDDPNRLRQRSNDAYSIIDEFVKRKLL